MSNPLRIYIKVELINNGREPCADRGAQTVVRRPWCAGRGAQTVVRRPWCADRGAETVVQGRGGTRAWSSQAIINTTKDVYWTQL